MNKWEKSFQAYIDDSKFSFKGYKGFVQERDYLNIKELVEQATNGIYISKEQANELLEALGDIKYYADESVDDRDKEIEVKEAYDKLRKSFGGK